MLDIFLLSRVYNTCLIYLTGKVFSEAKVVTQGTSKAWGAIQTYTYTLLQVGNVWMCFSSSKHLLVYSPVLHIDMFLNHLLVITGHTVQLIPNH